MGIASKMAVSFIFMVLMFEYLQLMPFDMVIIHEIINSI